MAPKAITPLYCMNTVRKGKYPHGSGNSVSAISHKPVSSTRHPHNAMLIRFIACILLSMFLTIPV